MNNWGLQAGVLAPGPHKEKKMTETTLLVLVLVFLVGCLGIVYYYDKKLVKAIIDYEKRLDKKGILKRHFSKPIT
jgi:hypothetical protein